MPVMVLARSGHWWAHGGWGDTGQLKGGGHTLHTFAVMLVHHAVGNSYASDAYSLHITGLEPCKLVFCGSQQPLLWGLKHLFQRSATAGKDANETGLGGGVLFRDTCMLTLALTLPQHPRHMPGASPGRHTSTAMLLVLEAVVSSIVKQDPVRTLTTSTAEATHGCMSTQASIHRQACNTTVRGHTQVKQPPAGHLGSS